MNENEFDEDEGEAADDKAEEVQLTQHEILEQKFTEVSI